MTSHRNGADAKSAVSAQVERENPEPTLTNGVTSTPTSLLGSDS